MIEINNINNSNLIALNGFILPLKACSTLDDRIQDLYGQMQRKSQSESSKMGYWVCFKEYMQSISLLSKTLQAMKEKSHLQLADYEIIYMAFDYLTKHHDSQAKVITRELKNLFVQLSLDSQDMILKNLAKVSYIQKKPDLIKIALNLLNLDQLTALANKNREVEVSIEEMAKSLLEIPLAENSFLGKAMKSELKKRIPLFWLFINNLFKILEYTLNVKDLQEKIDHKYQAVEVLSLYYSILLLPVTMATFLTPYFSSIWKVIAATAGLLTASSGAIISYYKWLRPCPNHLTDFRNLTEEGMSGLLDPVIGRDKEINDLILMLGSLEKGQLNPLLIGEPGVGKTEVIKGLAQKIVNGEVESLKGVKLFYINTTKIANSGSIIRDALSFMDSILEEIKGFENKVIFAFDEIHAAAKDEEKAFLDYLKTHVDPGPRTIHCIGLTTHEEYKKYLEGDKAFSRRFPSMIIDPPNKQQTVRMLKGYIQQDSKASKIKFSNKALIKIVEETSQAPFQQAQPSCAKEIVRAAIDKIFQLHKGQNCKLEKLKRKLQELKDQFKDSPKYFIDTKKGQENLKNRRELEGKINEKMEELAIIHKKLDQLGGIKAQKQEQKINVWKFAKEIITTNSAEAKKQFIFSRYYACQAISEIYKEMTQSINQSLPAEIDVDFVSQILNEAKHKLLMKQKKRGRVQLNKRFKVPIIGMRKKTREKI